MTFLRTASRAFAAAVIGVAAFAVPAFAQPVPQEPTQEEVTAFASDITVQEDGRVTIVERIQYYFPDDRHGIYRDLPERYRLDDGTEAYVPITVISVTDEAGLPWDYKVTRNDVGLRIRIGDPDKTITGWHRYDIAYEAVAAVRYDQPYPGDERLRDVLSWNVTGDQWEVPIRRVSATVRLPSSLSASTPDDLVYTACYTGVYGSTESDCVSGMQESVASFASNEPMTVVVGWRTGAVAHLLPPPEPWWRQWLRYLPWLMPLLVLLVLYRAWDRHGRDAKGRGTIMAEYDAPKGMTPAEVGVLYDEAVSMKDISAIIIDLAVRGYLKIREVDKKGLLLTSTDYEFHKLKDFAEDATLKPFEKKTLEALFGAGPVTSVSAIKEQQEFYKILPTVKSQLYEGLVLEGFYPKNPVTVRATWIGVGIAVVAVMTVALFAVGEAFGGGSAMRISTTFAALLSAAIVFALGWQMPRRTEKGALALDHVRGFHEYLDKAEKYRIQWQEKERIFEKFLPYAMAFGVAHHWSKAFEGMSIAQPSWYEGRAFSGGSFNPVLFYGAVNSMDKAMSTAMQSMPQSAGGGSGGFSGGGFGGGGGGSW